MMTNSPPSIDHTSVSGAGHDWWDHERVVRVFVSSTFSDMLEERRGLSSLAFRELRHYCDARGIVWSDIDLRWGITDEQKNARQVIPICLRQIDRCEYILVLLAERYGWRPGSDELAPLLSRWPELSHFTNRSMTELEIQHGVLSRVDREKQGVFLRNPKYVETLSANVRPLHLELPSAEEVSLLGLESALELAAQSRQLLASLKERIRDAGLEVISYDSPKALNALVLDWFRKRIDARFPPQSAPFPWQRARGEHAAVARIYRLGHLRRESIFKELDSYLESPAERPLVLVGESGIGKSAAIADWALSVHEREPQRPLVLHFCGLAQDSADWTYMVRRLLQEFSAAGAQWGPTPEGRDELAACFRNAVFVAAKISPWLIVIDGVDQLQNYDAALDLDWLPASLPDNFHVILSMASSPQNSEELVGGQHPLRAIEAATRKAWPRVFVLPLTAAQRERLVSVALEERFGKSLCHHITAAISRAELCGNALFLTLILEELCVAETHASLMDAAQEYLAAENIEELFSLLLDRWEAAYEQHPEGHLVGDVLSLLWAARRGLSEAELRELLQADDGEQGIIRWEPILHACGRLLANHSGRYTIRHNAIRAAIQTAYLPSVERNQHPWHQRLAQYFEGQPASPRVLEELPWHYAAAQDWDLLYRVLADSERLLILTDNGLTDAIRFWELVESHSKLRMRDAYAAFRTQAPANPLLAQRICELFRITGQLDEAIEIQEQLVEFWVGHDANRNLCQAQLRLAALLLDAGQNDAAQHVCMQFVSESQKLADDDRCFYFTDENWLRLQLSTEELGFASRWMRSEDKDTSRWFVEEALRECWQRGDVHAIPGIVAQAVKSQAVEDSTTNDLLEWAVKICRELGDQRHLIECLLLLASRQVQCHNLVAADPLLEEAQRVAARLGEPTSSLEVLLMRHRMAAVSNDLARCRQVMAELEPLCGRLQDNLKLGRALLIHGEVVQADSPAEGERYIHRGRALLMEHLMNVVADGLQRYWSWEDPQAAAAFAQQARALAEDFGLRGAAARIDRLDFDCKISFVNLLREHRPRMRMLGELCNNRQFARDLALRLIAPLPIPLLPSVVDNLLRPLSVYASHLHVIVQSE